MAIDRVMAIVDPTIGPTLDAQRAVRRALNIARRHHAELRLLICNFNPYIAGTRFGDKGLAAARDNFIMKQSDWLDAFADRINDGSIELSTEIEFDYPLHDGIVRSALRYAPHLLVKDAHYHPVAARVLHTYTDWHLIRECPFPLLLAKRERWSTPPVFLACVDPLHQNDKPAALDSKIMNLAQYMAEVNDAQLHVAHNVVPVASNVALASGAPLGLHLPVDELDEKMREAHTSALQQLLRRYAIRDERVHITSGSTTHELKTLVNDHDVDLVIMGTVSRSTLKRLFIGNTAERVLSQLPCDILAVKPDGFLSPISV